MEELALALLALRSLYKQQETLHSEAEEFRPFDLQQLRHLSSSKDKSPSRLSDREASSKFVEDANNASLLNREQASHPSNIQTSNNKI
jgi:hypothetical protein